jgi:hypothetical protein
VDAELDLSLTTGLTQFSNQANISRGVAILECGDASFLVTARIAQHAGAVCVIFVNTDQSNSDAVAEMRRDDSGETVDIPVLMVSHKDGQRASRLGPGTRVTFSGQFSLLPE